MVLVESVEAFRLVSSLAKRLEEAGVAEDKHVTELLTDCGRQTQHSHNAGHGSNEVNHGVRDVSVGVRQRRRCDARLDEAEHFECNQRGSKWTYRSVKFLYRGYSTC